MEKRPLSGIIIGIILILVGISLICVPIFASNKELWFLLIYGIPCFAIGIALLLWKKEDNIEQRKDIMKENKKFSSKHETRLKGGNKK